MVKFFLDGNPTNEIQDKMAASLEFEILYKLVNEKKFQAASEYVKENWVELRSIFLYIVELASLYQAHDLVKIMFNRLRSDKTIPTYRQKELINLVHDLDREVEMQMGCKITTSAFQHFTSPELGRLIDGHSASRIRLREGAKRLGLQAGIF